MENDVKQVLERFAGLSDEERHLLAMRFGIKLEHDGSYGTLAQVGEMIGMSAEGVRQFQDRTLAKLTGKE